MRLIDDSDEAIENFCNLINTRTNDPISKCQVRRVLDGLTPPAPTGPTVDVRIAVAVRDSEDYFAYGNSLMSDYHVEREALEYYSGPQTMYWLTATLPVPQIEEVQAMVEEV